MKRKLQVFLATLMVLLMFGGCFTTYAEEKEGSIYLNLHTSTKPETHAVDGELMLYQVADMNIATGDIIVKEDFAECQIDDYAASDSADLFYNCVKEKNLTGTAISVSAEGNVVFSGLSDGIYLITQSVPSTGYNDINPFLVSVPRVEDEALVYDVNANPKVTINNETADAELFIQKSSDKDVYIVGDTAYYQLDITSVKENTIAKQVVITDKLDDENAGIMADTIHIKDKNDNEIENATINANDFGFTIFTNTDLSYGEKITVTYEVDLSNTSLATKEVTNIATVYSENAEEVQDDHKINIEEFDDQNNNNDDNNSSDNNENNHYTPTKDNGNGGGSSSPGNSSGSSTGAARTGDNRPLTFISLIACAAIIVGAFGYVISRRKRA